jgi:hypothetical protein
LSGPFRADHAALPRLRVTALAGWLALTACGWAFQGASLWALLRGLLPDAQGWDAMAWPTSSATSPFSCRAGSACASSSCSAGARQLAGLLGAGEAASAAVVAAPLLRLLWTAAEAGCAAAVYWLPGQRRAAAA